MTIENEIAIYNKALPNEITGEVEVFDKIVFNKYIRKKELKIIINLLKKNKSSNILEIGCGAGWLSNYINNYTGLKTISFDISEKLVRTASKLNPINEYFIGDGHYLPIKSNSVDFIIGIAILHHLNHKKVILECKRILKKDGIIIFVEPNSKDPLMAIGRKFFRLDIHTKDEAPINPGKLTKLLEKLQLSDYHYIYLFPFAFPISYGFSIIQTKKTHDIAEKSLKVLEKIENFVLSTPLKKFASTFALVIKK